MSATAIGVFAIAIPDPSLTPHDDTSFALNSSVGFQYRIFNNLGTLSTKDTGRSRSVAGLLYVPEVRTSRCKEAEKQHVPAKATRLASLPPGLPLDLVAVAPWYDAQCTIEYFSSARQANTLAFLTYQRGNDNAQPPVLNDASWSLNDSGRWQAANLFPVYAVSSLTGNTIMEQLGLYSANITAVPHGDQLATKFGATDYIRLYAEIQTDARGNMPSLWVFLVIVLAILIIAVAVTSFCMHMMQRRRRNALRHRILAGEVDLEALGVRRLTVPQSILDKFPTYTYTDGAAAYQEKVPSPLPTPVGPSIDAQIRQKETSVATSSPMSAAPASGMPSAIHQPTCAICLDDFETNETQVRELPCRHIYHPDCIDTFLLNNSSLCPMCKQSVLPTGSCPMRITNNMVRRERYLSNMRARNAAQPSGSVPGGQLHGSLSTRIREVMPGRRVVSSPQQTPSRVPDIEMASTATRHVSAPMTAQTQPSEIAPASPSASANRQNCTPPQNRRAWAQQRAMAMLGNENVPAEGEDDEPNVPRWRKTVRRVFPGF